MDSTRPLKVSWLKEGNRGSFESYRCLIGLRLRKFWGYVKSSSSFLCSTNQSWTILAVWQGALSCPVFSNDGWLVPVKVSSTWLAGSKVFLAQHYSNKHTACADPYTESCYEPCVRTPLYQNYHKRSQLVTATVAFLFDWRKQAPLCSQFSLLRVVWAGRRFNGWLFFDHVW